MLLSPCLGQRRRDTVMDPACHLPGWAPWSPPTSLCHQKSGSGGDGGLVGLLTGCLLRDLQPGSHCLPARQPWVGPGPCSHSGKEVRLPAMLQQQCPSVGPQLPSGRTPAQATAMAPWAEGVCTPGRDRPALPPRALLTARAASQLDLPGQGGVDCQTRPMSGGLRPGPPRGPQVRALA